MVTVTISACSVIALKTFMDGIYTTAGLLNIASPTLNSIPHSINTIPLFMECGLKVVIKQTKYYCVKVVPTFTRKPQNNDGTVA